tara:strand:- start:1518 stop:2087 length:570 start_codon:yes stop_codon:yes gene_type:complete
MLGLGNGIPTGSAGDQLLVSYIDTFSSTSDDGWDFWSDQEGGSPNQMSGTGNVSGGDEGKLFCIFMTNQTNDVGLEKTLTSNGVSGDYLVVSYEISVGAAANKWGDGSSGNDIPVRTQWGGVTSSATNVAITDHSAGVVTISETITATGSYSGDSNKLIVTFLQADGELPLLGSSITIQNVRAHVYRPI